MRASDYIERKCGTEYLRYLDRKEADDIKLLICDAHASGDDGWAEWLGAYLTEREAGD